MVNEEIKVPQFADGTSVIVADLELPHISSKRYRHLECFQG